MESERFDDFLRRDLLDSGLIMFRSSHASVGCWSHSCWYLNVPGAGRPERLGNARRSAEQDFLISQNISGAGELQLASMV